MYYKKVEFLAGWIVFAVAAALYLNTIEPTVSFWDCGEFIACAARLEIGHQPGAPFFLILGRIFAILAGNQADRIALMINSMSALASAFTVMFLFRTIILLGRTILNTEQGAVPQIILPAGAFIGSMACAFSDTFWFSAAEGEVYATSSLFTAFVFWAMLKWAETDRLSPGSNGKADRWIILIAYLMGLSIGVHLLNLLCIPALVAIYYFRKYDPDLMGFIKSLLFSFTLLGIIVFLLIPWIIRLAAWADILFVNGFGLPVNSGALFYIALLFVAAVVLINFSHRKGKLILNKILIGIIVFLIGYSSYILLPVRAAANPPINLNKVNNPFSLLQYIGREQYITRPLVYGPYYNASKTGYKTRYSWIPVNGRYEKKQINGKYRYDKRYMTLFPRMSGTDTQDVAGYIKWAGIDDKIPDFSDNIRYFLRYQVGYMYWRYFMWNFSGRQTENQGTGDIMNGNWITGIPFIDQTRLGPRNLYPDTLKENRGRNEYYLLPLLLGIAGFLFHYRRNRKSFVTVFLFFLLTGLAIVVYLNEIPLTPRERDYAVGGSFYVFCIWIGLGTAALAYWLGKIMPQRIAAALAIVASVCVPVLMVLENFDDHDRSDRYVARDVAFNYLNSCDANAILFTNADNDTYPLWYAQEVEGIRTDVRVVLAPFLSADWYIEKLADWQNDAAPVNLTIGYEKYASGDLNYIPYYKRTGRAVQLAEVLEFMSSNDPRAMVQTRDNSQINYYPSNMFIMNTDNPANPPLSFTVNDNALTKHLIAILDIIAANNWVRPVYFLSTQIPAELGLTDYLRQDGFAYRLVPERFEANGTINTGSIDAETLYDKLMNRFKWGNMNDSSVFIDYNCIRTANVLGIRNAFARLAEVLINKGQDEKAVDVLDRCMELMPHRTVPYDFFVLRIVSAYMNAGAIEKARMISTEYRQILQQEMDYYASLKPYQVRSLVEEISYTQYVMERINAAHLQVQE